MFAGASQWISSLSRLLDIIYPSPCPYCQRRIRPDNSKNKSKNKTALDTVVPFCSVCWGKVRRLEGAQCPRCGAPFRSQTTLSHSPDHCCGDCRKDPPFFSRAITPYLYEGPLAKAIQLMKYQKRSQFAGPLAALLFDALQSTEIDLVMAIPLHPKKLRAREFNQSLLLAKGISRRLKRPLAIDGIRRVRDTLPQVGLSKTKRIKNIHRAFCVVDPHIIAGRSILLIDDVYTTGATLREGARILMKSGANNVIVAAPSRMVL
ncbi:MAG: ComF family protein [Nitrospiria bacterium]